LRQFLSTERHEGLNGKSGCSGHGDIRPKCSEPQAPDR
jgi:hypothetical protein